MTKTYRRCMNTKCIDVLIYVFGCDESSVASIGAYMFIGYTYNPTKRIFRQFFERNFR